MESQEGNKREEQKGKGKEKTRTKGRDGQKGKRINKEAIHTQTVGNRGGTPREGGQRERERWR